MTAPQRIVSLVPSWTETVFEFGAGDRLVGATRYCVEPAAELAEVPKVGGTKNPDLDAIAELAPDLVIVNREENRLEDIEWLGARFDLFESTPRTVREVAEDLRRLGARLDAESEARALVLAIEAELTRAEVEGLRRERPTVFYAIWKKPWMGVNRDTYIHDVLTRCGAHNALANAPERYPEVDLDGLARLGVDLVLLPDEPWPFTEPERDELRAAGTFGDAAIRLVDGKDFCWHGARTAQGLGRVLDILR